MAVNLNNIPGVYLFRCTILILIFTISLCPVNAMNCPTECKCEVSILEVRCVGRTLSSVPIGLPIESKYLILQWNYISFTKTTSNNTFLSLSNLLTLDLSRNSIDMLPVGLLTPLVSLEELNLSNNKITTINWNVFRSVNNLRKLFLNRNQITDIGIPVSPVQGNLQPINLDILHLGNNKIQVLAKGVLSSLKRIDTLYLQDNLIHTIEPGAFNESQVRYLNMGANRLTPKGFNVDHMSHLEELVVYSNKLTLDGTTSLRGLISLRVLSMASNDVGTIANGTFRDLMKLQELYLEGNNINVNSLISELSTIGDMTALGLSSDTMTEFPYWLCELYPMLLAIHITHSNIQSISDQLAKKCKHLTTINLKVNKISDIEPYAFANLTFKYLHLQANNIETIPWNAFNLNLPLNSPSAEVFLDLNPLVCDCRLKHLLLLPSVYQLSGKCASPLELSGRSLTSVNIDRFICQTTTEVPTTTTTAGQTTTTVPTTTIQTTTEVPSTTTTAAQTTTTFPTTTIQTTTEVSTTAAQITTTIATTTIQTTTDVPTTITTTVQTTTVIPTTTTNIETTTMVPTTSSTSTSTKENVFTTAIESDIPTEAVLLSEVTSTAKVTKQSETKHATQLTPEVTQSLLISKTTLGTSTPNVQTVVIKESNYLWAAYLSASLFAAILLILVVCVIICYQQRIKAAERVHTDVEHNGEPEKMNGKIPRQDSIKKNTKDLDIGDPIYIMEDRRVKIPVSDKNDNHITKNKYTTEGDVDKVNRGIDNNGYHHDMQENTNGNKPLQNGNNTNSKLTNQRKQSKEELKPMETVKSNIEGFVLIDGATDAVTKF